LFRRVLWKQQFDVVVRAEADEARQFRTTQRDAAHARRQVDHPQHFQATAFDLVADTVDGLHDHFSHSACS
jgi:hypothetical protein